MIKQLLDCSVCLQCRGCCRFSEGNSIWVPVLSSAEQDSVSKACPGEGVVAGGRLATVPAPEEGLHYCVLFSPPGNSCRFYSRRPLECRLYPFLINLNPDNGRVFLCLDMNCPFAAEHHKDSSFREYAGYLAEYLNSPARLEFFRREKRLLQSYPGEMPEFAEIKI